MRTIFYPPYLARWKTTRRPALHGQPQTARRSLSIHGSISFKDLERQVWTAKASDYDAWVGTTTSSVIEPLLDATHVSAGMCVLDVACGPGYGAGQA
jgi:hypothetical protein